MMKAIALALLTSGLAWIPGPSVVEMTPNHEFMPRELTVVVGEVIVWKNASELVHSVNTDPENCRREESKQWVKVPRGANPFFSGDVKPGGEFRVRFEVPGKYQYLCVDHEDQKMQGTIVVQGAEVK